MKKITIALIMVISLITPIQTMAENVTHDFIKFLLSFPISLIHRKL